MNTIDITPTTEETVRIYAYILAMQADTSPYKFGDYWNYTPEQAEIIVKAYGLWDKFQEAWEGAGLDLADMPKSIKIKFIKSAMTL